MSSFLTGLDEQQRAAAECVQGPVVIHAGAGTGKTRAITHRIAHAVESGVFEPVQTLAVTFTTRAAGELRGRLATMGVSGVQVRTFHSAALRQLRYFYPTVFDKPIPRLVASKSQFVAQAADLVRIPVSRDATRDLASEIEWAKVNILSPDHYLAAAKEQNRMVSSDIPIESVAKVYEAYLRRLDDENAMDFEDVLLLMSAILNNFPDVASQVRRQYRHFTVDEFQDVSPVQFELLNLWLGDRNDVCVVGDPAQTIYSFTGSTSQYLRDFEQHFPGAQRFELSTNYRSTPEIVALANGVMASQKSARVELRANRPSGVPVGRGAYDTDEKAASSIAREVASHIGSGVSPRDIAILIRTNAQSELFEAALGFEGVAYTLRDGEKFFERSEVKQAVLRLRAGGQVSSDKPLAHVVSDILTPLGWQAQEPQAGPTVRNAWESLNALVDLAIDFAKKDSKANLTDFVAMLDARHELEHGPTANAVTIASIHSAKGLEWENVFVVGLSEGLLPISHAKTPDQVAEEQRLLYVAVTRARQYLHLSWSRARHSDAVGKREASRFLSSLGN
ncbi:MAG: ATP-dependent helicase [Actinomycetes bacterium]